MISNKSKHIMKAAPDLSLLLQQFRLQGIPVGTLEYTRLQTIFASQPHLSREALNNILCTVLAKDDYQRQKINRIFYKLVPFEVQPVDDLTLIPLTASVREKINLSLLCLASLK